MITGFHLVLSLALASPELDVERGRVHLQEGRPLAARDAAVEALKAGGDWRAHRLYLEASEAAGLSVQSRATYELLALQDPAVAAVWRWHEISRGAGSPGDLAALAPDAPEVAHLGLAALAYGDKAPQMAVAFAEPLASPEAVDIVLRGHLALGDGGDAVKAARAALAGHPDHPEVLAALWSRAAVPGSVRKARVGLVADAVTAALASGDPVALYRARTAAVAGSDPAASDLHDALVAAGEARPTLDRPAFDAMGRQYLGVELAADPAAGAKWALTGAERIDVCRSEATTLEDSKRLEEALTRLAACRQQVDGFGLAGLHARLLLAADRHAEAVAAADVGLVLASRAAPEDGSRLDARRQSQELAAAQATRGAALQAMKEPVAALIAFSAAAALDPGAEWGALRARLVGQDFGRDDAAREANDRAYEACSAGDAAKCLAEADRALAEVARLAGPEPMRDVDARGVLATALVLRGTAKKALGDRDGALADVTQSALIVPTEANFALRAELLEAYGDHDAAFVAYAVAQGMGAPVVEALPRTWRGWGDWEDAAAAVVETWKTANPEPTLRPLRARGVRLGEPVPAFVLDTTSGAVTVDGQQPTIVVIAFWASWCGPCMQELPELVKLSRKFASEQVPVTIVAVSTDDRVADYERVRKRPELEGMAFTWNPELAALFRVTGIPSTWVIDGAGSARFHHTGYGAGAEVRLEREIRQLLP